MKKKVLKLTTALVVVILGLVLSLGSTAQNLPADEVPDGYRRCGCKVFGSDCVDRNPLFDKNRCTVRSFQLCSTSQAYC